jgi:hypothetical protein
MRGHTHEKLHRIDLVVTKYNFNNYNLIPSVLTAEITGSSTPPTETK